MNRADRAVFSSERTRAIFALVPTAQMADGAIRAELPVGSRRSDGPVGFAGPYGRNLMQAPPRIRVGSEFFCGTSALPIRAFRACGCCGPMPRRPPDSSATRALLSLAVAVCYRCASACAHSTVATPAGNAHRACQMSRALIPACGLYVKRPVSDLPPPRLPQPRTNLKGGRRACRRP